MDKPHIRVCPETVIEPALKEAVFSLLHFLFHVILFVFLLWPLPAFPPLLLTYMFCSSSPKSHSGIFFFLYIPFIFLPSGSFIPSSRAYWWKQCGCRGPTDRWWRLGFHHWSGFSERFPLVYKLMCWEMSCDAWVLCVTLNVHLVLLLEKMWR